MRNLSAICALTIAAALVVGCLNLGEKPTPGRTLLLSFPDLTSMSLTNASSATEIPQIREAVSFIEELFAKEGYQHISKATGVSTPGRIAVFAQMERRGFESYSNPILELDGRGLSVVFGELGYRGGHLHQETKRLANVIRSELSRKYGETRVKEGP
jgi:hypothetical protein